MGKHSKPTNQWVAGWNMPGYLPDNQPEVFDSFEDAQEWLAEQITEFVQDITDNQSAAVADE
jgi:hypothetical protein